MKTTSQRRVAGREITVSHPDKIFYPKSGFTKGDMLDYYQQIAPVLLPHLKGRAVTLKRYPDGAEGPFFYEKQCPSHAPPWLRTTKVAKSDGDSIDYCLLDDLPSLLWAANLANLELHPFLHRARAPTRPGGLVFDLDPGPPADVLECAQVALWIRDLFAAFGLESLIKTSGSKGLQLMVPLSSRTTYERTKPFAEAVAAAMAQQFPKQVTNLMRKSLRPGKVFIDWSQNDDKKTTVSVYSLRAKPIPSVSTPVTWEEVEAALAKKAPAQLVFTAHAVLERVARFGDLFAPALTSEQKLPALTKIG